jgi:beta-glucanase (GH16 family)
MTDSRSNKLQLVFSDEFNTAGRDFGAGKDPYWEAVDHYNPTTGDLENYVASAVTTKDGNLQITATHQISDQHPYTSGMLTSWNKFCFTGGAVEVSVKLPGDPANNGYWPAVWMMGNLARAGYMQSTQEVWPWSYDACDGNSAQWQKFSQCNVTNSSWGMKPHGGRGAPEFDILETNTCPTTNPAPGGDLLRCPNDTMASGPNKAGPRLFNTIHFTPVRGMTDMSRGLC